MQRAFELLCRYANVREAFGVPLADKQTVQNWIADSAADIQASSPPDDGCRPQG